MENSFKRPGRFKLPKKSQIRIVFNSFSRKEWAVFSVLVIVLCVATLGILGAINRSFLVGVPMKGGSVSEGVVGAPRFVNPVLALSDADQDLVNLVYSGLMRKNPDGSITPDLAEKYEVSPDGLTYTFTLRDDAYFHDGTKVTAEDVLFTVNEVKDQVLKSPKKGSWDGITAEKTDDRTIVFSLRQPYASFLDNATLGILPEHVWANSPLELNAANVNAIGSGPFEVQKVTKESSGIIDSYELVRWKKFNLGEPYLKAITLKFYPNEDAMVQALEDRKIDQVSSISPENAEMLADKGYRALSAVLPRIFGLFFNQSQNQIFTDKNVIIAIDKAVNKEDIVKQVLSGYGVPIDGPIPPGMAPEEISGSDQPEEYEDRVADAKGLLAKDGWTLDDDGVLAKTTTDAKKNKTTTELAFSISTGNAPELARAAQMIASELGAIGMKVDVKTFETGNLNQAVIRPRKYDALLFGEIINDESDLFAFWHSSQRKDPGLNVALYTNAKVDKILEDAFTTVDPAAREEKYAEFEDDIRKDMPAVFLYSPSFIYVVEKDMQNISIDHIVSPADRFLSAYLWYTQEDRVWKIFSKSE